MLFFQHKHGRLALHWRFWRTRQKAVDRPCFRSYNNRMEIEFDPRKDAANLKKHGISLAFVRSLVWDEACA